MHGFCTVYSRCQVHNHLSWLSTGLTWSMLCGHAEAVVDTFTDARIVDNLRCSRRQEDEAQKESCGGQEIGTLGGDMVFENAILFLRDGLILREFSDAIKSAIPALWASQLSRERAQQVRIRADHRLHTGRRIVLNNWLMNPTGKANSFVELDLMQEHLNYWIKTYYQRMAVRGDPGRTGSGRWPRVSVSPQRKRPYALIFGLGPSQPILTFPFASITDTFSDQARARRAPCHEGNAPHASYLVASIALYRTLLSPRFLPYTIPMTCGYVLMPRSTPCDPAS
ncbi:hypothetical protein EDB84DRAFT_1594668 [Lactarius hengduanensis]|nr:hypothetical protein EDB84DRAFT_1594668 [Lactarius hengduanensis]